MPYVRDGFMQGLLDGMLARRLWDPSVARARKTGSYLIGTLFAASAQPLALLTAVLDWQDGLLIA